MELSSTINRIRIEPCGIIRPDTDAIVNAANSGLWAGGGVCGVIFRAAGRDQLQKECDAIGGCPTGSAVITGAYALKAQGIRYIIHAVGPDCRMREENARRAELLSGAYTSALQLAKENACRSIAFPLISAGIYGYPKEEAWEVAIKAAREFLKANGDDCPEIIFTVPDSTILEIGKKELQKQFSDEK